MLYNPANAEHPRSCKFAITITLKPMLFKNTATEQYDETYLPLHRLLKALCFEHTVVAELTKAFNVHYHGVVVMPDWGNCRKRFVDAFRKSRSFGYVCIKMIDDEQGWYDYIRKGIKGTRGDLP